ncbi:hypothetical protein [Phycicoccus avicenniae]|uniref:hypothetical protein n=1 Tax=Phycicoccus avicenniae TaxID=2828860 RepID=UPI003D2BFFB2
MTTTLGPQPDPHRPAGAGAPTRIPTAPRVPTTPPAVTVRPASASALRHVGLAVVTFFVLFVVGLQAMGRTTVSAGSAVALVLPGFVLAAAGIVLLLRRWGRLLVTEIELGYTTSRPRTASWWLRNGPKRGHSVVWDLSGLWFLRPSGEVRAAPLPTPHPPGWYPSPRDPARLELWTGCQWSGLLGARTDGLLPH